ncbi:MAG: hypothetical protein CFK52_09495 [Chloracidobacterium sp. CP2_5A]|nr:MAG: hypothetical protein CFK52_09495 [Chloracidobacterium sp. CP2_5A]
MTLALARSGNRGFTDDMAASASEFFIQPLLRMRRLEAVSDGRPLTGIMTAQALPASLADRQFRLLTRSVADRGDRARALAGAGKVGQPANDQDYDKGEECVASLEAESHAWYAELAEVFLGGRMGAERGGALSPRCLS